MSVNWPLSSVVVLNAFAVRPVPVCATTRALLSGSPVTESTTVPESVHFSGGLSCGVRKKARKSKGDMPDNHNHNDLIQYGLDFHFLFAHNKVKELYGPDQEAKGSP